MVSAERRSVDEKVKKMIELKNKNNLLLSTNKGLIPLHSTCWPSLARAGVLVHYYSLAGRLTISPQGKLIVDCTREGAVFIEAEADCNLNEIGDSTKPDPHPLEAGSWC